MLSHTEFTSYESRSLSSGEDVFVFDLAALVPGTCCQIDHDFAVYLRTFANAKPCYLLTSVSYNELMARLPTSVRKAFRGVFASSGAELWSSDEAVERVEHTFSDDLYEYLVKVVQNSAYPAKDAPLIENGPATLRVCLAGTKASIGQLSTYLTWETEHRELPLIVNELKSKFPDHDVHQDSDTSLLVAPVTMSTSRIHRHITSEHSNARVISCMSRRSANGFAEPFCNALSESDLVTEVGGPSDLSQLMSYEMRRRVTNGLLAAE
ncbi:MAG: hypothetical protein RDA78_22775 [Roseibium sp.]|uniref:hypothetical protein n=1 Tax=Roseibium sp. TaxID=1936156 RepID=UPI003D9C541C